MDNKLFLLALTCLLTLPIAAMEEGRAEAESSADQITIELADGEVNLDKAQFLPILKQSKTISDLLEDIPTEKIAFPLPNITKENFELSVSLMKFFKKNKHRAIDRAFKKLNVKDLSIYWNIFNYLDVPGLLKLVNTDLLPKLFAQVKDNPQAIPELLKELPDEFKRTKLSFSQLESFLPEEIKNKLISKLKILTDHTYSVWSVDFNPQGNLLATGSRDGTVIIYDISNPEKVRKITTLTDHPNTVWSVRFNPQGTLLATISGNNPVIIYDISNPKKVGKITILTDHTKVRPVAFNPQGTLLATGSVDGTVIIYDISNPEKVRKITTLTDHTKGVSSVAFNPQGTLLATGSFDGTVIIYDISNPEEVGKIATLTDHDEVSSVAFNSQGTLLATGSWDNTVIIYDISNPEEVGKIATLTGHTKGVSSVAFNSQGTLLATGSWDNTVIIYDISLLNMFKNLTVGQALAVSYLLEVKPKAVDAAPQIIQDQINSDPSVRQWLDDLKEKAGTLPMVYQAIKKVFGR